MGYWPINFFGSWYKKQERKDLTPEGLPEGAPNSDAAYNSIEIKSYRYPEEPPIFDIHLEAKRFDLHKAPRLYTNDYSMDLEELKDFHRAIGEIIYNIDNDIPWRHK